MADIIKYKFEGTDQFKALEVFRTETYKKHKNNPFYKYLNAIIEYDDTETETMEEGCLSLPGIHENVKRPTRIHVKYLDRDFVEHDEWISGYLARVMQHEFDHLDAKMFVDRITPLRKQLIKNKLKAIMTGRYRCAYRTRPARR